MGQDQDGEAADPRGRAWGYSGTNVDDRHDLRMDALFKRDRV